jgi:hypothetical protein
MPGSKPCTSERFRAGEAVDAVAGCPPCLRETMKAGSPAGGAGFSLRSPHEINAAQAEARAPGEDLIQ